MSAYVLVELTVNFPEKLAAYAERSAPILARYKGEIVVNGELTAVHGGTAFARGLIIKFPDSQTALDWYNSEDYKEAIVYRDKALVCRVMLLG
nr:DUF1330 domain-containing protein [Pseudomonas gingeri]